MHRMIRQTCSLILAAVSFGLTGCGRDVMAPTTTNFIAKKAPAAQAPAQGGAALGALPTVTLPQDQGLAADFGDASIIASIPGAGATLDSEAPGDATADGADFTLSRPMAVRNQIIVQVKPGAAYQVARFTEESGSRVVQSIDVGTTFQVVTLPSGMSVADGMAKYGKASGVSAVMPNRIYGVTASAAEPNDPFFDKQWGADKIDAPEAWAKNVDGSGMTVAVLDTGVDYRHPEFGNRVIRGWNFADNTADVMDRFGHGTHVAGIIGASGNNGVGVAGVAWNSKILAVKVLGDNGQGSTAAVISGIRYAADMGVKIINLSLGSPDTTVDPALSTAIAYANAKGCLVIAAAGNNHGEVGSPANDPGALAVSSTSKFLFWEYMSWFSNHGNKIEVSAPGGSIYSTLPLDANKTGATGYGKLSGTSMAAPFVSGEAALIWAKHPNWTAQQVRNAITSTVDHKGSSGRNARYGYGRINLAKALAL
ncbi:S8 family serine peptidase [bacterium]|nr:S8 family serine peptidase [bacterium]